MKKKCSLITLLFFVFTAHVAIAQSGNSIEEAIVVDDETPTNISDILNASASGMMPSCATSVIDVFYKNVVSSGDNSIEIGMETNLGLLSTVRYQIFKAPQGDLNNLEEVVCASYHVILAVPFVLPGGGSFNQTISNVSAGDVFYLRVYKVVVMELRGPADDVANNTYVEMSSKYDNSLETNNVEAQDLKVVVKENAISLFNNTDYSHYQIFGIDGKKISSNVSNNAVKSINISKLKTGIYILALQDDASTKSIKFVKN